MKTEKLTWLMFIALIAIAFGVVAFTAPQLNNQILAGFMSLVFGYVFILTLKY
jgi:4-hydroxybenzoate polyprenyltransferase